MTARRRVMALVAAVAVLAALPAGAREARIGLPDRGALVLDVPAGWREQVSRPDPSRPPAIVIQPDLGAAFKVLLVPNWPRNPQDPLPDDAAIRAMVERGAKGMVGVAVEASIPVVGIRGAQVSGAYFSATDRKPAPGDYPHLTQGLVRVGRIAVAFQVYDNGDPAVLESALRMIRSLRHS